QFLVAPVAVHARVQEILVDRGQLIGERAVEKLDDLGVALHGGLRWNGSGHDYSATPKSMTKCKWGWFADASARRADTAGSGGHRQRKIQADLAHGLIENAPRLGLAAAAAGRAARAGLQLRKTAHAALRRLTDIVAGHGLADANVHGHTSTVGPFKRKCE